MTSRLRLLLAVLLILGSSLYGLLISINATTGIAVGMGYVAVVLTIFLVHQVGRFHDGNRPSE